MIHSRYHRLVFPPDRPDVPSGISLDVPVLRRRLLRTAQLTAEQERLTGLVRSLLDGHP
ncbi:hypothetical protein [Streptomyces sp. Ru71]|uniref:hypothetical protein n=1 Tax=Streptomyces sp. Ru71 TaxID=2080746 RepID=UPI002155FF89|nr:hypothetical protein [Streptomyces sp. Ru71]